MTQHLTKLSDIYGGEVYLKQFLEFCHSHPQMLYPAYDMQKRLRQQTGGEQFWFKMEKRREDLIVELGFAPRDLLVS